jgi:hypothetical protein
MNDLIEKVESIAGNLKRLNNKVENQQTQSHELFIKFQDIINNFGQGKLDLTQLIDFNTQLHKLAYGPTKTPSKDGS